MKLEEEKKLIEDQLSKPEVYSDFSKLGEYQQQFEKVQTSLTAENQKWEALLTELETLNN